MRFILWSILLLLASCASHQPTKETPMRYTDDVFAPVPFIAHEETGPFKSYLAMNLPYTGFQPLLQKTEKKLNLELKNRGEAHITVITPPEFDKVLSKKLSIKDISQLAEKAAIQQIAFKPLCIGKGTTSINGTQQSTYYVVIASEDLFKLRKSIHALYVAKGGNTADFNPDLFFPHVTLGYTERDLHFEDGIKKDASSCIINLEPGPHTI